MSILPTQMADRLLQTVAGVLGVDPETLSDESSPETIASWDSLNHLNLILALESEYGITLSPDDALELHSIGRIRAFLGEPAAEASAALVFTDCRAEHVPALKEFIARSYGRDYVLGVNDAYFQWQYGGTPAAPGRDYHIRLALVEGEIAGCLGYIPVEVSAGGEVRRGAWLANWMVDPEQRHIGLGPLLAREVARDFEITLAAGANREARDILGRMGWTDFGLLLRWVCVLDEGQAAALAERGRLDDPVVVPGSADVPAGIRRVPRFDGDATDLWDRTWGAGPLGAGTRRTAEYLNWRYADHRQFEYRLIEDRDGGQLTGLAVYRIETVRDRPVRVGRLVELIAAPECADRLLMAVLADARTSAAAMVDFFCASPRLSEALARCGFLPGDHPAVAPLPMLFQPLDRRRAGISFLADVQNLGQTGEFLEWYATKSDGDQDRPN